MQKSQWGTPTCLVLPQGQCSGSCKRLWASSCYTSRSPSRGVRVAPAPAVWSERLLRRLFDMSYGLSPRQWSLVRTAHHTKIEATSLTQLQSSRRRCCQHRASAGPVYQTDFRSPVSRRRLQIDVVAAVARSWSEAKNVADVARIFARDVHVLSWFCLLLYEAMPIFPEHLPSALCHTVL